MGIQYPPIITHEGPLGNPRIMPGCFGGKIIQLKGLCSIQKQIRKDSTQHFSIGFCWKYIIYINMILVAMILEYMLVIGAPSLQDAGGIAIPSYIPEMAV